MTFTAVAQGKQRKIFLSVRRYRQRKRTLFEEFETWSKAVGAYGESVSLDSL
jgi:hypothetical protein